MTRSQIAFAVGLRGGDFSTLTPSFTIDSSRTRGAYARVFAPGPLVPDFRFLNEAIRGQFRRTLGFLNDSPRVDATHAGNARQLASKQLAVHMTLNDSLTAGDS
jgi:hypothetical protein